MDLNKADKDLTNALYLRATMALRSGHLKLSESLGGAAEAIDNYICRQSGKTPAHDTSVPQAQNDAVSQNKDGANSTAVRGTLKIIQSDESGLPLPIFKIEWPDTHINTFGQLAKAYDGVVFKSARTGMEFEHNTRGRVMFVSSHPHDGALLICEATRTDDPDETEFIVCQNSDLVRGYADKQWPHLGGKAECRYCGATVESPCDAPPSDTCEKALKAFYNTNLGKPFDADYGLCQDEGCPHHGTPHVCLNLTEGQRAKVLELFSDPKLKVASSAAMRTGINLHERIAAVTEVGRMVLEQMLDEPRFAHLRLSSVPPKPTAEAAAAREEMNALLLDVKERFGVTEAKAIVKEFGHAQFMCNVLDKYVAAVTAAAKAKLAEPKIEMPQQITITITDSDGKTTTRMLRSTFTPNEDLRVMEAALDFEQANRLRKIIIKPIKVGHLWMMSESPLPYQVLTPGDGTWADVGEMTYNSARHTSSDEGVCARLNPNFLNDKHWMRELVFADMKECLALPDGDEARIGPEDALRALNHIDKSRPVEVQQAAEPFMSLSDGKINEIAADRLGHWPSFQSQAWACRVVHAVLDHLRIPNGLTFDELRAANIARLPLFKNCHGAPAHSKADGSDWTPSDWLEAVTGELGEYANFHKKFRRGDITFEEFQVHAAKELADVQTYLDILAMRCLDLPDNPHPTGIVLGRATTEKFNEVSRRVGCNVFLRLSSDVPSRVASENADLLADNADKALRITNYADLLERLHLLSRQTMGVTIDSKIVKDVSLWTITTDAFRGNHGMRHYQANSFHEAIRRAVEKELSK